MSEPQEPPIRDLYESDEEFEAALDRVLTEMDEEGVVRYDGGDG